MTKLVFFFLLCLVTTTSISAQTNTEDIESEEQSDFVTHGVELSPYF